MHTPLRITLAAAALVAAVTVAEAQTAEDHTAHHPGAASTAAPAETQPGMNAPPAMMGPGGKPIMMGNMMQGDPGAMMMRMMAEKAMQPFRHIEGQIAFYKAELQITDSQAPQWNAFADALRQNAKTLQQAMMAAMPASRPVPEQMEQRIALLTTQLNAAKAVHAAAEPLYARFTPEQKTRADGLMAEHTMPMQAGGMCGGA